MTRFFSPHGEGVSEAASEGPFGAVSVREDEEGARRPGEGPVQKVFAVLDTVAEAGRPLKFSELLALTGYAKGTLHRLLKVLVEEGALIHDEEARQYRIGMRIMRLAHAAWRRTSLVEAARDALDRLSLATGETLHLAVLDACQVLYVDKRLGRRVVSMYSSAGKIAPAYCTGIGKALLSALSPERLDRAIAQQAFSRFTATTITDEDALRAELSVIRARGYALDEEEHEPGIVCLAMPILSVAGELFGAVSITSARRDCDLDALLAYRPGLDAAVRAIAAEAEIMRLATL
ncbi:IclR family transcriptional regulator [Consotaella salsifontis]|uniref:Transcriptional regulator, IclR family n=1 Tax=Consotaella salsifontis TaxID=1365950 RepID=A0A1T4RSD1_9HYPH|nr:IclR family transcriptional regulator [Consotaella salsifontis]SKA18884.1 transcriptional regulator, IclR family [Consotaella salsifontis]